MSNNVSIQKSVNIGGKAFAQQQSINANAVIPIEKSVPAAQPGTLTVRTNNSDGSLTMGSGGHGIITGARMDIYWAGGCRRGAVVGTVAGTTVPFTGGTGDNLPVATTAVQAAVPVSVDLKFTGDNVQAYAAYSDARGQFAFNDVAPAEVGYIYIATPALSDDWDVNSGKTSIFVGDLPIKLYMSHSNTAGAQTMRFGVAYN